MSSFSMSLVKPQVVSKLTRNKNIYNVFNSKKFSSMKRPTVLITRPDFPKEGVEKLRTECNIEIYDKHHKMTKEELLKRIPGKNGVFCALTDQLDKETLDAAGDQLKVISTMSVGYDHIDLDVCRKKNILVSNTPNVSADCVAEWTVMLMIGAGRNFIEAAAATKLGDWTSSWGPTWLVGAGLQDAVVGIVGMGRIGQCILRRVLPFGVKKVLYNDAHHVKPAEDLGACYSELNELVQQSDFIVCMCNLSDETRNLFNKRMFDMMKPTAIFVNTSRGDMVNHEDLYDALKNKKIGGAAIDVTIHEPMSKDNRLTSLSNLIITPHVASSETNTLIKMSNLATENLLLGLKGKPLKTPVPVPV